MSFGREARLKLFSCAVAALFDLTCQIAKLFSTNMAPSIATVAPVLGGPESVRVVLESKWRKRSVVPLWCE